ncbi:hypothetical protein NIES2100_75120 [Calothrix sp. NIES-2100]|nr:hypothetical protein NIES2100_75120 [Calothrix sp. NIES-2100]
MVINFFRTYLSDNRYIISQSFFCQQFELMPVLQVKKDTKKALICHDKENLNQGGAFGRQLRAKGFKLVFQPQW